MKYRLNQYFLLITLASILFSCSNDMPINTNDTVIDEQLLLELVNNVRVKGCDCGEETMPPVDIISWDETLSQVAQSHSTYMFENDKLSHTGKNKSELSDRVNNAEYQWRNLGENIAHGYSSENEVIDAWLTSPGHCKNIMDESFDVMGVARQGKYWTQVLAQAKK